MLLADWLEPDPAAEKLLRCGKRVGHGHELPGAERAGKAGNGGPTAGAEIGGVVQFVVASEAAVAIACRRKGVEAHDWALRGAEDRDEEEVIRVLRVGAADVFTGINSNCS